MSWLRTVVNRAVEVGGSNNLTRTVRNYADSVVQHAGQAVSGGARILQDRIAARNLRGFSYTVKMLEEMSVACRGLERVQLLRRWLVALKEIERVAQYYIDNDFHQQHSSEESKDSPRKPTVFGQVLYYDPDFDCDPVNFRDVFLHSQALEGVTLSMILEAPNEEEASLLLEIFGLCITGGKEVHNAIVSNIQDLAKVCSSYKDEVLVKREELLQYAQDAIAGLKINADLARMEAETSSLQKKVDEIKARQQNLIENTENLDGKPKKFTIEALKDTLALVRLSSKLEELILKKKSIRSGDSPEVYAQKVDKLKILSESLASSSSKAENRILDHRSQKEEALNFRVARANEIDKLEKELEAEVQALQKQRDELEAELKKVSNLLSSAIARLYNARDEGEQFEQASDQIVALLKMKEDEFSRSINTYRAEANAVNTWIKFLEETWVFQTSCIEQGAKQVNDELVKYGDYIVNLTTDLLSAYKRELGPSISCIEKLVEDLNSANGLNKKHNVEDEKFSGIKSRKILEDEYLEYEARIITIFSVVDSMKKHFHIRHAGVFRNDDQRAKELFEDIDKMKNNFETIKRPYLEIETPSQASKASSKETPKKLSSFIQKESFEITDFEHDENLESLMNNNKRKNTLNPEAELSKLKMEFGKGSTDFSADEICDWEFDELEHDLKTRDSIAKD